MSIRMLQRRLTEQGITFQRLLEDARRELARHYLLQSSVELSETAYLLGYEDANSFGPSTIGKGSLPDNGGYSKRTHSRQHNLKSAQGEARKHSETVSMGAAFE